MADVRLGELGPSELLFFLGLARTRIASKEKQTKRYKARPGMSEQESFDQLERIGSALRFMRSCERKLAEYLYENYPEDLARWELRGRERAALQQAANERRGS